jgi:hypothetical protein
VSVTVELMGCKRFDGFEERSLVVGELELDGPSRRLIERRGECFSVGGLSSCIQNE